jgi:hypothetical protein
MPVLLDFERKRQSEGDCRRFNMKILLGSLAAILFIGAIAYFLLNTTTPFTKLRMKEEAVAAAPVTAGGSPSSSRTALPEQSTAASGTISTAIHDAVSKVKSWFGQIAPPPKPAVAVVPHAQTSVAAASPPGDANVVTITRDVSVHIKYGIVGLRRGTRVAFVSRDGANVRVRGASGNTLVVPASATDLK